MRADALEGCAAGLEVTVASGRGRLPAELARAGVRHLKVGSRFNTALHYLLSRLTDAEGRGSILASLALARRIKAMKPDEIILHNLHGHYLNLGIIARCLLNEAKRGARIIWRMHDLWPVTGHCAFLPPEGCDRFFAEKGCGNCPMQGAYPATAFDFSARNFKRKRAALLPLVPYLTIRAVSAWQGGLLKRSFLQEAAIEVVHPAVNDAFTPPPTGTPRAGYVLAAAYPWQKYKGLGDLAEIRRLLPQEIDLVAVGLTKSQAKRLRRPGLICVEPLKRPSEMAWYMRQASVFINPSYAETFGLTSREALACGTPVAVYAVGGATEGIDGLPSVRSVPCGDVEALVRAAGELRSDYRGGESNCKSDGKSQENHIEHN